VVQLTPEDWLIERDPQLEKAIDLLINPNTGSSLDSAAAQQ
jgi:hypothetical protein